MCGLVRIARVRFSSYDHSIISRQISVLSSAKASCQCGHHFVIFASLDVLYDCISLLPHFVLTAVISSIVSISSENLSRVLHRLIACVLRCIRLIVTRSAGRGSVNGEDEGRGGGGEHWRGLLLAHSLTDTALSPQSHVVSLRFTLHFVYAKYFFHLELLIRI